MNAIFPIPPNPTAGRLPAAEEARLADLASYAILDTAPEFQFDSVATLARALFDTPMAAVSLVDRDRQWLKARSGPLAEQAAREHSFCAHVIEQDTVLVVPDATLDPRFSGNPMVLGAPKIRFYVGAPLRSTAGHNLGAVCVISPHARDDFSAADRKKLEILAGIVVSEMELRKQVQTLTDREQTLRETHYRLKNSLDYADLLAEVQSADIATEKLALVAMAAWKQYSEAGGVLMSSIKSLRARMSSEEYRELLSQMPGFAF